MRRPADEFRQRLRAVPMSYELTASAERSDSPRPRRPARRSRLRARHSSTLSTMPGAKKADGWSIMAKSTAYMTRHTCSSSAATACHGPNTLLSASLLTQALLIPLTPRYVAETQRPMTCSNTDLYK